MMQIQTQVSECYTLLGEGGAHTDRVQSDEEKCTQGETSGFRLPWHFESHILINDHRRKGTFTSRQPSESAAYIRVRACAFVRVSVFSLINGGCYSVLLNFISSGSLQGIEQAPCLSPCVCVCGHMPSQSTTVHAPVCR